jgi:predicted DNA-binding protein (MmcQ/YjbR family)
MVKPVMDLQVESVMDYPKAKEYILGKLEAVEDYPFGPDVAVFKIRGKMFATLAMNGNVATMNLKCTPEEALQLRDVFDAVIPGYHMNKKHWNTVILNGTVPVFEIERMIDRSYGLVVKGLKKAERQALETLYGAGKLYR